MTVEKKSKPMRAGGRATEAGMAFQAEVGTWVAAHILARSAVGGRFGINNMALPSILQLETGEGLDDIEVTQSDGGSISIQCKTRANLSTGEKAPLTKTLDQLALLVSKVKISSGVPDLTKNVGVLAVRHDAPATLDVLHNSCCAFNAGGHWSATKSQRNKSERSALETFEKITGAAWSKHTGKPATEEDFVDMARYFRIERFSMNEGSRDWRESSRLIGNRVYGSEAAGEAVLRDLRGIVRDLISSGAPADRVGLLRELRKRGHIDCRAPNYESDISKLQVFSQRESARLALHQSLPIGGGVPVRRESDELLSLAIRSGSVLVIGEPGAGKTGALLNAVENLAKADEETVLFFSVDRFPGVAILADFQSEIGLDHSLTDVLLNFPGGGRKTIVIDALDASRGGPAEAVFATLIEDILALGGGDWTIVASIRTFDLKNGRRFRSAFAGKPPVTELSDTTLSDTCHIQIPMLSQCDLEAIAHASPRLGDMFSTASPTLQQLLRNIFNLSLAAQLLQNSVGTSSLQGVQTQSELIDLYENERLPSVRLQRATAAAIKAMVSRQRISVRKVTIDHDEIDRVIQTGVLVDAGDLVSFSHHILFDHVAGRFYLEWDNQPTLIEQIKGDTGTALLLAPALRFAVERLWRSDKEGPSKVWSLIVEIFSTDGLDPVFSNVALRAAIENVKNSSDIIALEDLIRKSPDGKQWTAILPRLSRFVGLDISSKDAVPADQAIAWAHMAKTISNTGERFLSDAGRYLLQCLFEKGDFSCEAFSNEFGTASRNLLAFAWADGPKLQQMATNAIRFVGKSFASDLIASRALLEHVLKEPRFSAHADSEAPWLAEQVLQIAATDPEFAVKVYSVLFTEDISDEETTFLGGNASRILPLSSNRKQDFEHARWQLRVKMRAFLQLSAEQGTRALIDAHLGYLQRKRYGADERVKVDLGNGQSFEIRGRDYAFEVETDSPSRDDDMLGQFLEFLRVCEVSAFSESLSAALRDYSCGAVWARLFRAGAERVQEVADLLWDVATIDNFLFHEDTLREVIDFISASYSSRSEEQRCVFETNAMNFDRLQDEGERERWRSILSRLLSKIPEDALVLETTQNLRREMAEAGELQANTPLRQFRMTTGNVQDFMHEELQSAGVNIDNGPNAEVLSASDALHELVQNTPPNCDQEALALLWKQADDLVRQVSEHCKVLDDKVARPAWGHISNAVELIASNSSYDPSAESLPSLEILFQLLHRLSASRFPEHDGVEQ